MKICVWVLTYRCHIAALHFHPLTHKRFQKIACMLYAKHSQRELPHAVNPEQVLQHENAHNMAEQDLWFRLVFC